MEHKKDYRKASGKRVEGQSLAIRIAQEINGMMLAQAFIVTKSAGFQLKLNKLDGVTSNAALLYGDRAVVNVDVINGIVKKSWAT